PRPTSPPLPYCRETIDRRRFEINRSFGLLGGFDSMLDHIAVRCPRLWITSLVLCDRCDDVTGVAIEAVPDGRG
ncbi:hypothetical protein PV416_03145, partial [Streptomyces ipomoeae]|uniref:hypothetical protein n=1 Tax=Streptomyces ipomoeae TaxID=103232 RepID=UPI00299FF1AB